MAMFRSLLFAVLAVFGTDSSIVEGNTREIFKTSKNGNKFLSDKINEQPNFDDLFLEALKSSPIATDEVNNHINESGDDINRLHDGHSSHEKDAANGNDGTAVILCYGRPRFGAQPKISCRGSCFIKEHWSPLGLHIDRGCSPHRQRTRLIKTPPRRLERFCNTNLCNFRL